MTPREALVETRKLITPPKAWTQHHTALTRKRQPCGVNSPTAACWCLTGALFKVTKDEQPAVLIGAFALFKETTGQTMISFNDSHSHRAVLEAIDKTIGRAAA